MKVKTLLSCLVSFLSINISGQQANPIIPDTPPSPQAEAFNRLGNFEVNNNYGVPDINIPLFEIDFHGYKIPLTLHYEASPMKSGYNYDGLCPVIHASQEQSRTGQMNYLLTISPTHFNLIVLVAIPLMVGITQII